MQTAYSSAIKNAFLKFFVKQPLVAFGQGALSAGIMQGLANTVGVIKKKHADKQKAAIEAGGYLLTPDAQEFDDLSPEAQKMVEDAAAVFDKKKNRHVFLPTLSKTAPAGTQITPDFTGAVAVEAEPKTRIRDIVDTIQKKTGIKIGFAEYYQDGQKNTAYKGHYDPTTKTLYFRKGAGNAEIIYKTAMHELTHAIEQTRHYSYVRDYVLNKAYGGEGSERYKTAIQDKIDFYAENGQELTPEQARAELVAEKLREAVFASGEDVRRIVEQDYTFAQHVHDWIDSMLYYVKTTFGAYSEAQQLTADLEQAQRKYRLALASAKGMRTAPAGRNAYEFVGTYFDRRKVYKTNYAKGTENRRKSQDIINVVQNVWSKNPITLTLVGGEKPQRIVAKFDPTLEERSDLSKIAFGNRKGSGSEKRMTLDLSTDLYAIANDSKYNGSKSETGKDNKAHNKVRNWVYFVTNLIYEDEEGQHIPCFMNIDVKQRADGEFFYSFAIEKGVAPQTLLAAVAGNNPTTTPNNNVSQTDPTVKNQFSFSSPKSDTAQMYVDAATDVHFPNEAAAQEQDSQMNGTASQQQDFTPAPDMDKSTSDMEENKIVADMDDKIRRRLISRKRIKPPTAIASEVDGLSEIDKDALQNKYKSAAKPILKRLADQFGVIGSKFENKDIALEFVYSNGSFNESVQKQHKEYATFAKMLTVFDDVVKNAIGIEVHKDKYAGTRRATPDLENVYVLAGAFYDGTELVPVQLEVKEFKNQDNKLYLSVCLKNKMEAGRLAEDADKVGLTSAAPTTSNISIYKILQNVNPEYGDFLKYFPDDMLSEAQPRAKNNALFEEFERIEDMKQRPRMRRVYWIMLARRACV